MAPSAVENGGKSYNKKMQYFTICDEIISWLPNYRINLLLFLNKSRNLISEQEIKLPNKKCIVDTIIYPYLISEGDEIVRACDRH